jgi:hypothetical protein
VSSVKTYTLFIGHNVESQPTWDSADVASAVVKYFPSFTLVPCVGTWHRVSEATSLVVVATLDKRKNVIKSVQKLTTQLGQECIMVQRGKKTWLVSQNKQ